MSTGGSLSAAYFDALYARENDPWRFATSPYEEAKYSATLQALATARFASAFEVGCSIGVLTQLLANRCDRLLAVDVAEAALAQARRRCADLKNVAFEWLQVPDQWPQQTFDLILLSEVLYYLSPDDVSRTAQRARNSLRPQGTVLLVHYILPTDYPCSGDTAAEIFIAEAQLTPSLQRREAAYRLDLLRS
jgi:cyclopropane fatty-acyl-phospholipid synthase-like methyltransferase